MPLGPGSSVNGIWKYGEDDPTGPLFSDFINKAIDNIRTIIVAALLGDTGWQNLPLANGWASSGGETAQYRKLNGVVSFRGLIAGGSTTSVATLPAGTRPPVIVRNLVRSGTGAGTTSTWVHVDTAGLITTATGVTVNLSALTPYIAA